MKRAKRWVVMKVLVGPLVWLCTWSDEWAQRLMDWEMNYKPRTGRDER
jgi:hypothetical protein